MRDISFDEYEEALNEKTLERASPFRETLGQLIVGDCFKCIQTDMQTDIIWQVVSVNYDWNTVKAVKWEERMLCPTIHVFDFFYQVVRYKLV